MAQAHKTPGRFLDAAEEPTKDLAPIEGYEKATLLSLEKSMPKLDKDQAIHNLETMLKIALRNSRKPAEGLTQDESAAIHLYTMQWADPHPSLYTLLNQALRAQNRNKLKSWFPYLKLFLTALYKLPSFKGTIWRGVRGNISDDFDVDLIWWGISSCTEKMRIMEEFVGVEGPRTIFNIQCVTGKVIRAHSHVESEAEVLLMPGTYLQVVDKWSPAKDLYMVQLQEATPPYQTIAPPFTSTKISVDDEASGESFNSRPERSALAPPHHRNPRLEQKVADAAKDNWHHLRFRELKPEDMGIVAYYAIQNNQTLTSLELFGNQIRSTEAEQLCIALLNNKTLTSLGLVSNQIDDAGARYLAHSLSKNQTLISVNLATNQIGPVGAQYLTKALLNNRTLKVLSLRFNESDDKGAEHFANALSQNQALTSLDLSQNQISSVGVQYLANALLQNKTLKSLDLQRNQIDNQGYKQAMNILKKSTGVIVNW